jgi:hypothetical protein
MMDANKRREREAMREQSAGDAPAAAGNPLAALNVASQRDPLVWRQFWRTMNLLERPETLMQPDFLQRVMAAAQHSPNPEAGSAGPSRPEMLDLLAGA